MRIKEICFCGAALEIEVDQSNKIGTPTWDAILTNIEKWRLEHQHSEHPDD